MSHLIDMEETVRLLRTEHGIENAHVEHTGGGTWAIYAGPTRPDEENDPQRDVLHAALAGPGYVEQIDGDEVLAFDAAEIYVGCDDHGLGDDPSNGPVDLAVLGVITPEQVANVIAAQAKQADPSVSITEDAARALLFG